MTRDELADKIRHVIHGDPMWDSIQRGATWRQCKEMSTGLYRLLQEPENRIDGLSLAVVTNYLKLNDHGWLVAYHPDPDIGYFMIDPTIGQFVNHADTKTSYNDVFIGTYYELEKMLSSGDYTFRVDSSIHRLWSPALRFYDERRGKEEPQIFYTPSEVATIWNHYEFPISEEREQQGEAMKDEERYGIWAARMEEAGVNWRHVLRDHYHREEWPDPEKFREVKFLENIMEERNRHIQLGTDGEGISYQERLGKEYAAKDKPAQR